MVACSKLRKEDHRCGSSSTYRVTCLEHTTQNTSNQLISWRQKGRLWEKVLAHPTCLQHEGLADCQGFHLTGCVFQNDRELPLKSLAKTNKRDESWITN